jgi:hypothetical protein
MFNHLGNLSNAEIEVECTIALRLCCCYANCDAMLCCCYMYRLQKLKHDVPAACQRAADAIRTADILIIVTGSVALVNTFIDADGWVLHRSWFLSRFRITSIQRCCPIAGLHREEANVML